MVRFIPLACIFLLFIIAQESIVEAFSPKSIMNDISDWIDFAKSTMDFLNELPSKMGIKKNETKAAKEGTPTNVWNMLTKGVDFVKEVKDNITHKPSEMEIVLNEIKAAKEEILKPLRAIPYDIRDLKGSVIQKIDNIQTKVEVEAGKFFEYSRRIDHLYDNLIDYIELIPYISNETWLDFIQTATSLDSSETISVDEMHQQLMAVDVKGSSLLYKLAQMDMELMCARKQSPAVIIIQFYDIVQVTDGKDLAMKLFAYYLWGELKPPNTFDAEIDLIKRKFLRRLNKMYSLVRDALSVASRDLYTCDSNENIKGVTYTNVCDGNLNTNNYFSLTGSYADTDRNYVVTGAKIVLENNIFYIQIQQGLFGINATIIPDTVEWKPINKIFEIRLWGGFQNAHRVDKKQHTVYLDDVEPNKTDSRPKQVVTGLKFGQIGSNLLLQVASMSYNDAGELYGVNTWHESDYSKERTELSFGDEDPINFPTVLKHEQDSKHGQYVNFRFGANTAPFIDIQEITTDPPVPLGGAGLFHKGQHNSSGYLALKLIHYDLRDEI